MQTHAPADTRSRYLVLSALSARLLSAASIGGLYLWFVLKLFVDGDHPWLQAAVGIAAVLSIIGCIIFFLCSYSFLANAPSGLLDERELAQRNAAYLSAYKYVGALLVVGMLGSSVSIDSDRVILSKEVIRNFLTLAFFTALVMPAAVLAWSDTLASSDSELDLH